MTLSIYYKDENNQYVHVTSSYPIKTVHNGKDGDVKTLQLYLRNDDNEKWYSNIIIKPIDLIGADPYGDVVYRETGWGVKLSDGSAEPSNGEWEDIEWGEEISMSNIGSSSVADSTTYYPFWYLITCPPNEDVKIKTDIVLEVGYTENMVLS
jgi:hypothetical protein